MKFRLSLPTGLLLTAVSAFAQNAVRPVLLLPARVESAPPVQVAGGLIAPSLAAAPVSAPAPAFAVPAAAPMAAPAAFPASAIVPGRAPAAVLFDWDDTIVDEKANMNAARGKLIRDLGAREVSPEEADRVWSTDRDGFYSGFFPNSTREEVDRTYYAIMEELRRQKALRGEPMNRPLPGAVELLQDLKRRGVPLGVVSNKPEEQLRAEIASLGLTGVFQYIQGHTPARELKPSAQPLNEALKAMGVDAANAWYVGDELTDMQAARAAGLRGVLLGTKRRAEALRRFGPESGPALIPVDGHRDLRTMLAGLVPAPAAPAAGRRVYLLSSPLRETVRLGPISIVAHAAYALAWEVGKTLLAWHATHSPAAVAAVLFLEMPASPAMVTMRSLADLGLRYWARKLSVLREIARAPGVERIRVLTTGEVRFFGPMALSKDNTGLIFVESSTGLPETVGRFGEPLAIGDLESQRVRLTLSGGGVEGAEPWTLPLGRLLDGRPLPEAMAAAWRAAISPAKALSLILDASKSSALRVDAALVDADGVERPIGAVAEGPAVKTLVGLGRWDRARAWLGLKTTPRSLPSSDTVVERPGDWRESGFKSMLSRAWRRLSGSLIVAKS